MKNEGIVQLEHINLYTGGDTVIDAYTTNVAVVLLEAVSGSRTRCSEAIVLKPPIVRLAIVATVATVVETAGGVVVHAVDVDAIETGIGIPLAIWINIASSGRTNHDHQGQSRHPPDELAGGGGGGV
jgi:hypothetical protein